MFHFVEKRPSFEPTHGCEVDCPQVLFSTCPILNKKKKVLQDSFILFSLSSLTFFPRKKNLAPWHLKNARAGNEHNEPLEQTARIQPFLVFLRIFSLNKRFLRKRKGMVQCSHVPCFLFRDFGTGERVLDLQHWISFFEDETPREWEMSVKIRERLLTVIAWAWLRTVPQLIGGLPRLKAVLN